MVSTDTILKRLGDFSEQWSTILRCVPVRESGDIRFADNDGQNVLLNLADLDLVSADYQMFFTAQQLMHVMLSHKARGSGRFPGLWRHACDVVVNTLLREDGFVLPSYVPTAARSAECGSAEELYYRLLVENDFEDEEYEPDMPDPQDSDESKSKDPGDSSGARLRVIDDPGLSAAVTGLADMLETSLELNFDWFPGDTVRDGLIRDRFRPYPIPHAEILLDTSSSVDAGLLRSFVKGVKALLSGEAVLRVGCFDTEFYGFTEVSSMEDIDSLEFIGSGGTSYKTALDAFTGDAQTQIIFTDGCAEMPEQFADVIWVVYGTAPVHPFGGRVIYVKNVEEKEKDEIVFLIT